MRYSFVTIKVPEHGCFVMTRQKNGEPARYLYQYLTKEQAKEFGLRGKRPARIIGRLVDGPDGKELLSPNENYYKLNGIEAPKNAVLEGSGRKPCQVPHEPAKAGGEASLGYGLAVKLLFAETGVTQALEKALGEKRARQITALASYMCEGTHKGLSRLKAFCEKQFPLECSTVFDSRRAGELFVSLKGEERTAFFTEWNRLLQAQKEVFYDVTSFSTYSANMQVAEAGYNRDKENLIQVNIGLFCDRGSGLPLYVTSYNGSINDMTNFNHALELAKENGMTGAPGSIELVTDGGFSQKNFCWAHLNGYSLVAGVSCDKLRSVREKFVAWANKLSAFDFVSSWRINGRGHGYVSSRAENFVLGGVTGTLVMYRDLSAWQDQTVHLAEQFQERREFLENLAHWPGDDFDAFAKSYEDQFTITRDDSSPKGFTFKIKKEAISESAALCGKTTLFTTNSKLSDRDLLKLYRSKEAVEERFDVTKNDLSDSRLHLKSDRPLDGKLFCAFAGLILWRLFNRRLGDLLTKRRMSVSDAIAELEDIEIVRKRDGTYMMRKATTKLQKEILAALGCFKTLKDAFDARDEAEKAKAEAEKARKKAEIEKAEAGKAKMEPEKGDRKTDPGDLRK